MIAMKSYLIIGVEPYLCLTCQMSNGQTTSRFNNKCQPNEITSFYAFDTYTPMLVWIYRTKWTTFAVSNVIRSGILYVATHSGSRCFLLVCNSSQRTFFMMFATWCLSVALSPCSSWLQCNHIVLQLLHIPSLAMLDLVWTHPKSQ